MNYMYNYILQECRQDLSKLYVEMDWVYVVYHVLICNVLMIILLYLLCLWFCYISCPRCMSCIYVKYIWSNSMMKDTCSCIRLYIYIILRLPSFYIDYMFSINKYACFYVSNFSCSQNLAINYRLTYSKNYSFGTPQINNK